MGKTAKKPSKPENPEAKNTQTDGVYATRKNINEFADAVSRIAKRHGINNYVLGCSCNIKDTPVELPGYILNGDGKQICTLIGMLFGACREQLTNKAIELAGDLFVSGQSDWEIVAQEAKSESPSSEER